MERSSTELLKQIYDRSEEIIKTNSSSVNNGFLKLKEIFSYKKVSHMIEEDKAEQFITKIGLELEKNIASCEKLLSNWKNSKETYDKIISKDGN